MHSSLNGNEDVLRPPAEAATKGTNPHDRPRRRGPILPRSAGRPVAARPPARTGPDQPERRRLRHGRPQRGRRCVVRGRRAAPRRRLPRRPLDAQRPPGRRLRGRRPRPGRLPADAHPALVPGADLRDPAAPPRADAAGRRPAHPPARAHRSPRHHPRVVAAGRAPSLPGQGSLPRLGGRPAHAGPGPHRGSAEARAGRHPVRRVRLGPRQHPRRDLPRLPRGARHRGHRRRRSGSGLQPRLRERRLALRP